MTMGIGISGAVAANVAIEATLTAGNQEFGGSLGSDFIVNTPIVVSQLGAFDDGGDGMNRDIGVAIFARNDGGTPADFSDDTGGAILGQTTFTNAVPGSLVGSYRMIDITPINLDPGTYTIVGWGYGPGEANGNDGNAGNWPTTINDGGGAIEFVGASRFGDAATAGTFPATPDGGPTIRYGAGNFAFDVVPEPSATCLVALGLSSILLRRRRN